MGGAVQQVAGVGQAAVLADRASSSVVGGGGRLELWPTS